MTKRDIPLIHPGEILLEDFMKPLGISQYTLTKAISVPPRRINEIVHRNRAITALSMLNYRVLVEYDKTHKDLQIRLLSRNRYASTMFDRRSTYY